MHIWIPLSSRNGAKRLTHGNEELRPVGVGAGIGHGQQTGLVVLDVEVLVGELLAKDGLATSSLGCVLAFEGHDQSFAALTLPRVKSPPWAMKPAITRWNFEPE